MKTRYLLFAVSLLLFGFTFSREGLLPDNPDDYRKAIQHLQDSDTAVVEMPFSKDVVAVEEIIGADAYLAADEEKKLNVKCGLADNKKRCRCVISFEKGTLKKDEPYEIKIRVNAKASMKALLIGETSMENREDTTPALDIAKAQHFVIKLVDVKKVNEHNEYSFTISGATQSDTGVILKYANSVTGAVMPLPGSSCRSYTVVADGRAGFACKFSLDDRYSPVTAKWIRVDAAPLLEEAPKEETPIDEGPVLEPQEFPRSPADVEPWLGYEPTREPPIVQPEEEGLIFKEPVPTTDESLLKEPAVVEPTQPPTEEGLVFKEPVPTDESIIMRETTVTLPSQEPAEEGLVLTRPEVVEDSVILRQTTTVIQPAETVTEQGLILMKPETVEESIILDKGAVQESIILQQESMQETMRTGPSMQLVPTKETVQLMPKETSTSSDKDQTISPLLNIKGCIEGRTIVTKAEMGAEICMPSAAGEISVVRPDVVSALETGIVLKPSPAEEEVAAEGVPGEVVGVGEGVGELEAPLAAGEPIAPTDVGDVVAGEKGGCSLGSVGAVNPVSFLLITLALLPVAILRKRS